MYDNDRLISNGDPELKVLPVTAVFGGNAFGKSNFVEALRLFQVLVLEPAKDGEKIPVSPFFLDPAMKKLPTSLDLHILSEGVEYKIFVKLTKSRIIEEKLTVMEGKNSRDLYHRRENSLVNGESKGSGASDFTKRKIVSVFKNLKKNTLLLSSKNLQKMSEFRPVYNWFKGALLILSQDTKLIYVDDADDFALQIGEALRLLATGVETIKMVPVKIDEISATRKEIFDVKRNLKDRSAAYFTTSKNDMLMAKNKDGKISFKLAKIVKVDCMSNKIYVNAGEESNGTRRLLQILPAILQLHICNQNKVLVIDELDKSLHIEMTRRLVEYHVNNTINGAKPQLIFTTHNVDLIDNCVLRNDEIWIVEKRHDGCSGMMCLNEFEDAKKDIDFQQLYKNHNLGGTPNIFLLSPAQLTEAIDQLRP